MKKNITNIIKKFHSNIFAEYLSMFLIMAVFFFGVIYLADKISQKVVWYGIPSKISMSGDFRFYPSDEKGQRLDEHWFWAVPEDINDVENIQKIYEILEPQGVYKITGTRDEDDCDYYRDSGKVGDFPCVASLTLLGIVRVGTTTNESPVQYAVGATYNKIIDSTIPILDLPLRYFSDDSVAWGLVNATRNYDDKNTWTYATIDGGDTYQSFPTKTITLSSNDFSNSSEQLPPTQSIEQILKQDVEKDAPWRWLYDQEIKEYGDLATRFLPSESIDVKKFDVDKDGKDETIIFLCGVGGNHCPHRIVIVKDKKIVFSVSSGLTDLSISKTETGQNFIYRLRKSSSFRRVQLR